MAGSTEDQLAAWCSKYPWFAGVYAADELPEVHTLEEGAAIIVNYISRKDAGQKVGHWCAILHLGSRMMPPSFFDSFAFAPDQLDRILEARTHFTPYLERASQAAGWHGEFYYNHESLQCVTTDSCGLYACWAVKTNTLPQDTRGNLSSAWFPVWDGRSGCEAAEHNIRNLVRLPK